MAVLAIKPNMAIQRYILSSLLLFALISSVSSVATMPNYGTESLHRSGFPEGFIFGTASASYQYEGAVNEGGRTPSIWDTFTHKYPGKIQDHSNGDVAEDQYHRYKEDIKIMKEMGFDAYRFSISWSRILPKGKLGGGVNKEGINYYNNLINELLANGLQPYVTIFHWDLPQALEDEYGGFLSPKIVDDFQDYAEILFKNFGDRVKHWITLNEPASFTIGGYAKGAAPPGRCSDWQQLNCTGGNSATEPYIVTHHQLLAHAATVKLYKSHYQATQKGVIGFTLATFFYVPFSHSKLDKKAAERSLDFTLGWFMDPVTYGEYPLSLRSLVGDRLPKFSDEQSKMLKGSIDFVGLNYYTANYAAHVPFSTAINASYLTDSHAKHSVERNGIPIGPKAGSDWLHIYPKGIRDLLLYVRNKYKDPVIYITENGVDEVNNGTLPLEEQLVDTMRIHYYHHHLSYIRKAMKLGAKVKGYFAWSLLDNFEWSSGYTVRFGIYYVDYKDGLKRYPKFSARWFKKFLKKSSS